MPFRRVSTAAVLKNPGEDSEGWNRGGGKKLGGVDEAEDMSCFDCPTVPFLNFHFRGRSMSVTTV